MIVPPVRPEYIDLESRLTTFSTWPDNAALTAERLARAGFFYTGEADCTRCFCCGGGVRNWRLTDNEWLEHARHFPRCQYVQEHLGPEVVDTVVTLSKDYEQITVDMVRNALL
ncbi:hypothetical protein RRG08_001868 [Elysia crispata]|uniref:Uncharacterized protein n=1 Tax=Elysia crispata TaxID=231223 RepID=A0AAE1A5R5_9GAST|nr:hypothetical protein RRG08_001868 [Elysia crispata]